MKRVLSVLLAVCMFISVLPAYAGAYSTDYPNTWANTGNQANDIVQVALSQVGYHETGNNHTKYNAWFYGYDQANEWCAIFISWCANQAGIPTSIIQKQASAKKGKFGTPTYNFSPSIQPGDIAYIGKTGGNSSSHVGIVVNVSGNTITTVEGNNSDKVKKGTFYLGSGKRQYYESESILFYGRPNYGNGSTPPTTTPTSSPSPTPSDIIDSGKCGLGADDKLYWTLRTSGVLTISGTGDMMDFYQSGESDFLIDAPWWRYRTQIEKVVVEEGAESIGADAFGFEYPNLKEVVLPNSLEKIDIGAFAGTPLTSIDIPEGVTRLGGGAFSGCENLSHITLPSSLQSIDTNWRGSGTFEGCISLTSIEIPSNVQVIGEAAFRDCTGLTTVVLLPNNLYGGFDGVNGLGIDVFKGCTNLDNLTASSEVLNFYPEKFPSTVENLTIISGPTLLDWQLPFMSNLKTLTICPSVQSLEEGNFFSNARSLIEIHVDPQHTDLMSENGVLFSKNQDIIYCYPPSKSGEEYMIPSGVKTIGYAAFENCSNLKNILIPEGVEQLSYASFAGTDFTNITIPKSLTSLHGSLLSSPHAENVYYSGTKEQWRMLYVKELGADPGCNLETATIHCADGNIAPGGSKDLTPPTPVPPSFTDVAPGTYYAQPVIWAYHMQITLGTSPTTFSPSNPCTRAQIVTFLWRSAGRPEAARPSSFEDVPADGDFKSAIDWAVEQGITNGTGPSTFSPNAPCTRDQAVTFLWRAAGKPTPAVASSFTDAPVSGDFKTAIDWAVEKGITNGTSPTKFSPKRICTRGDIVTFLYRYTEAGNT